MIYANYVLHYLNIFNKHYAYTAMDLECLAMYSVIGGKRGGSPDGLDVYNYLLEQGVPEDAAVILVGSRIGIEKAIREYTEFVSEGIASIPAAILASETNINTGSARKEYKDTLAKLQETVPDSVK